MRTRPRRILLLVSLLLIVSLTTVTFWLYSPFRQELLFITNAEKVNRLELQWKFARQGWTLRRESIPWNQVSNNVALAESIQNHVGRNTQLIVCAPVITFALEGAAVAIKPEGSLVQSVGMGKVPGFDYLLVPQEQDQGWIAASIAASEIAGKTPLPTVLMYSDTDKQARHGAQLFSANFTGGILDTLPVDRHTERQMQSTMEYIQDSGALLVVVPYVANFAQYLGYDTVEGLRWIVDELYAPLIEERKLEGVVYDDVYLSLQPLLQNVGETTSRELPLIRNYRPYGTKWQNWF